MKRAWPVLAFVGALLLLSAALPAREEAPAPGDEVPAASPQAKYVGTDACLECHDELEPSLKRSAHWRVPGWGPEGEEMGCESCHGPGSVHVDDDGDSGMRNPRDLGALDASAMCLKCHDTNPAQTEWRFSRHAHANVSCLDCHRAHPEKKEDTLPRLLADTDPELCYECHKEQQAQVNWPSHHPIREGRMACGDCHDPHGSGLTAFRNAPTERELCLNCHARHRGPFIQEHTPVAESCTQCHRPHGAVEDNLLTTSEPALCLRCHPTVHNPHRVASLLNPGELQSNALFFSRCSVCHPAVHGSDIDRVFTR